MHRGSSNLEPYLGGSVGPLFAGTTFDPEHDAARLSGQLERVFTVMKSGKWLTLAEIAREAGGSEAGVSARLRDLRKEKFGGHSILRQRRGDPASGLFEYRLAT